MEKSWTWPHRKTSPHRCNPPCPACFAATSAPCVVDTHPDAAPFSTELATGTGHFRGIGHNPRLCRNWPSWFALLVVEVADATLLFDRTKKTSLYASARIPDYWIVNIQDKCIEIYRDPIADPSAPFSFRYKTVTTLKPPNPSPPRQPRRPNPHRRPPPLNRKSKIKIRKSAPLTPPDTHTCSNTSHAP